MRLHPFRALRPAPGRAAQVSSPPYDVMSGEEARVMVQGRPDSFLRVVRSEVDLPEGADPHSDAAYRQAQATLRDLMARGVMVQREAAGLWLYRLEMDGRSQTGWVGCADVEDYRAGRVRKHEYTRPDKEDDRTRHVELVGAQTGPVFLTCHGTAALQALSQRLSAGAAEVDFVADDGVRHSIWSVTDAASLSAVAAAFEAVSDFYIADGHHRAASAARVRDLRRERTPERGAGAPWERFLTVVFPADELSIMAYNRVVADLHGLTPDGFIEAIAERFEVGPPGASASPDVPRTMVMYVDGSWRTIRPRPGTFDPADPVASLDVAILQDGLLEPVLGIRDPRRDPRIAFVGGIRGTGTLAERVDAQGTGVAFSMFPTAIEELLAVADADQVMPPKSTWFEPKLRSGLFVHLLDD